MHDISRRSLLPILGAAFLAPAVLAQDFEKFTYRQIHMGMIARITLYAGFEQQARQAASAAFKRIADIDTALSDFNRGSENSLLTRSAANKSVKVSDDLYQNLKMANEMANITEGIFDVSLGPLSRLWREGRLQGIVPSHTEVSAAQKAVGWKHAVAFDRGRRISLKRENMIFDFGGIGKGYAIDEAGKMLRSHGIMSALVELGGDVLLMDAPPESKGWSVEALNGKKFILNNVALSTTGAQEQYMDIAGQRLSHVINPITGHAITSHRSLTIFGERGFEADALATSLGMMSRKEGDHFIRKYFSSYRVLRT